MIAFKKFKEIDSLPTLQDKHKAWLEVYEGEGIIYSIAAEGKHKMKWSIERKKYKTFQPSINLIGRLPNRTIIEFDDEDKEKAKENLEKVYNKLKEMKIGFIRSTHKGKTDYLWIEFSRNLKDKEVKSFLQWICPENATIDLNFASSRKVFPILYATHWRHSFEREMPIEYFEGEQIDYDSLNIPTIKEPIKITKRGNFLYHTFKKGLNIFTKQGQVEEFQKIQPLFYDKAGLWWLWDDKEKKWEVVDEIDILNMISETTGEDTISSKNRTEILNALKQEGRKNIPQPIKPTWIQFKDTIVDIETGKTFKATPKYFVTNPIPYKLHKEKIESTPTMDKIFEEWVGKDYVKTLYEILSYCLIPDYPIHRLFCFVGKGMNGKTCFLRLLTKFIGKSNITSTELDTLLYSRFEVTRLHKKLVCQMGETNFNELSKTSLIKKLTGQDIIGFEYKNKNPFEDKNYAKIIIATNTLPVTTDKTIGFYRRWCIIDFPNTFSEQKDILEDIPEEEYESLALKSLIILKDLLKKRSFHNEGEVREREKRYEDKSNPLDRFLKEECVEDVDGYLFKKEFRENFKAYLEKHGYRKWTDREISLTMKEKDVETKQIYIENFNKIKGEFEKTPYWAYIGLKYKQDKQDKQDSST